MACDSVVEVRATFSPLSDWGPSRCAVQPSPLPHNFAPPTTSGPFVYFERPYWAHPLIPVASRHNKQTSTCAGKDPTLVSLHFRQSSSIGVLECSGPPALSVIPAFSCVFSISFHLGPPTTMHYVLDTLPSSHFSNPAADRRVLHCKFRCCPVMYACLWRRLQPGMQTPLSRPASNSAAVSALSTTDRQRTGCRGPWAQSRYQKLQQSPAYPLDPCQCVALASLTEKEARLPSGCRPCNTRGVGLRTPPPPCHLHRTGRITKCGIG